MIRFKYLETLGIQPFHKKQSFANSFVDGIYWDNFSRKVDKKCRMSLFKWNLEEIDINVINDSSIKPDLVTDTFGKEAEEYFSKLNSFACLSGFEDEGVFIMPLNVAHKTSVYYKIEEFDDDNLVQYAVIGLNESIFYHSIMAVDINTKIVRASFGLFTIDKNVNALYQISNTAKSNVTFKNHLFSLAIYAFKVSFFKKTITEITKKVKVTNRKSPVYYHGIANNAPYRQLDATWYTNYVRLNPFLVSGHVRMQRIGKGRTQVKKVFIRQFQKNGYKRLALMKKAS